MYLLYVSSKAAIIKRPAALGWGWTHRDAQPACTAFSLRHNPSAAPSTVLGSPGRTLVNAPSSREAPVMGSVAGGSSRGRALKFGVALACRAPPLNVNRRSVIAPCDIIHI